MLIDYTKKVDHDIKDQCVRDYMVLRAVSLLEHLYLGSPASGVVCSLFLVLFLQSYC